MAKHHMSNTKIYHVWQSMKHRCYLKSDTNYYKYGARGITVCDEWWNSFEAFYNWAIENGYEEGLSIDRIDNNGNYEPSNCRWVTRRVQANNTRRNKLITYAGKTQSLPNWCRELNLNYKTVRTRIGAYKWSVEKALSTPTIKECEV